MKICYLSDANNYHTQKWCDYFVKKGYEIHVISLQPGKIPGAKVYAFDESNFNERSEASKLSYMRHRGRVRRLVHQIQPDILHAHYATSYGMLGASARYHPLIISVWGSDVYDFPTSGPIHRWFLRQNLKPADMIMSTSKDMARVTSVYTDKDIKVTPFGVNVDVFKPLDHIEKEADFVVGAVKTLLPNYGIDSLINGFDIFRKRHPEGKFRLEIAGTGPQEGVLRAQVKDLGLEDMVVFLGFITMEEVAEAFNRMDVTVIPSSIESFGVSAVEAQACGTPVIASNVGGLPEATYPGVTSILIEPKNPAMIADALDELYLDPDKLERMSAACRPFVLDHYNIEDNFAYVDRLYQELVFGKGGLP